MPGVPFDERRRVALFDPLRAELEQRPAHHVRVRRVDVDRDEREARLIRVDALVSAAHVTTAVRSFRRSR